MKWDMASVSLRQIVRLGGLSLTLLLSWMFLGPLFNSIPVSNYLPHISRAKTYNQGKLVEVGLIMTRPFETPEDTISDTVQLEDRNLPVDFWNRFGKFSTHSRNSCLSFPKLSSLQFSNNFWQVLKTPEMSFMLLNAYYDDRERNVFGPSVRIISMISQKFPSFSVYCKLWFEGFQNPVFTETVNYEYMWATIWSSNVPYQPFLITCNIPSRYQTHIPAVVSLVESHCEKATNALRILYDKPVKRKEFAVCVKALDFYDQDISLRLVEWIELVGILGADKIFFYKYHVHRNISKVLQYYQKLDRVVVTPSTQPAELPNIPFLQNRFPKYFQEVKRRNEVIQYNDCLYRNLHSYKYIALIDIDEVFIPKSVDSWESLLKMHDTKELKLAAFCSFTAFFLDYADGQLIKDSSNPFEHIPKYLHMLQHVNRSHIILTDEFSKCFHNTELAVSVHNHFPLAYFESNDALKVKFMPETDVILHHYRTQCKKTCKTSGIFNSFSDTAVWKYRDELIRRSIKTLRELDFIVPNNVSVSISK